MLRLLLLFWGGWNQRFGCSVSFKGNVKRLGGFPNLLIQPMKNCMHPSIVRVATAAGLIFETSTRILKIASSNLPLLPDAQFLLSTLENLKLCDCSRAVTLLR